MESDATKRRLFRFVIIVACLAYMFTSFYIAYLFFMTTSRNEFPDTEKEFSSKMWSLSRSSGLNKPPVQDGSKKSPLIVDIWGKAAIGLYLWEHILGGSLQDTNDGLVKTGHLLIDGIEFKFSTGPGVVQGLVDTNVRYLVLVVNGRDRDKVRFATAWLDYLNALADLRGVALVLLGNETCDNSWLMPYMRFSGGLVDVVFLVYDSPLVDNNHFYQWPLGVATYRGFPRFWPSAIDVQSPRLHKCSFAGTVYRNSSRERLVRLLQSDHGDPPGCIMRPRFKWQPAETAESLRNYVEMLLDSELTLSPIGINAECYRIYEALSCGSLPVVENIPTGGKCTSSDDNSPLRLLKKHGAPMLYVQDWALDLPAILRRQKTLTEMEKVSQRRRIIKWYVTFLDTLRKEFVNVIKKRIVKHFE